MSPELRAVFDTNVLVSALLRPKSVPRQAFDLATAKGALLISEATLSELQEVLQRPKFHKHITVDQRREFLAGLIREGELVPITDAIVACRDPKDDKFLDLSVSGDATHLISGDADLLELHPFRSVAVVTPQQFLELFTATPDPIATDFRLTYPFYVIGTPQGDVFLSEVKEHLCVLGYATRELAELYLQQAADTQLIAIEIRDIQLADSMARAVSSLAKFMVWNAATIRPQWLQFVELSQLSDPNMFRR